MTVLWVMIINTFHKKGKPQKVTVERLVHSAVSTDIHGKLTGKESCRRKRCTSNGDARCLEGIVNNLGEHHKKWTEAGVSAGDTRWKEATNVTFLMSNHC